MIILKINLEQLTYVATIKYQNITTYLTKRFKMKCLNILSLQKIYPNEWWYHIEMKHLHFDDLYECEIYKYTSQSSVQDVIWD